MRRGILLAATLAIGGSAVAGHAAAAALSTTIRVSLDVNGGDPDASSEDPVLSADGSVAAFSSPASNLVPGDGNLNSDVFVRDIAAGTTERITVDVQGADANGFSGQPAISADGRYVAFLSDATNLIEGDDNGVADVFVRDRVTGATTRVGTDAGDPRLEEFAPSISGDGRTVGFVSFSPLVPEDGNGFSDVYVYDTVTGATERVSVDMTGGDPNDRSESPTVDGDGRYVGYVSAATNLVVGDGNGLPDLYVRDRQAGTNTRASVSKDGGDPDGRTSPRPWISANGRYITFASNATNLVARDRNGWKDVFVRDLHTSQTARVSVNRNGYDANAPSLSSSISADGRYVAFRSGASDLVVGDSNDLFDIFLRDMYRKVTIRITVNLTGGNSDGASFNPTVSADGGSVGFVSWADNLVSGDANSLRDAFVRVLGT